MNRPQQWVLGAWLTMIALTTVRSLNQTKGLPQPSQFLGSGVLFTIYFGAAAFLGPLAAVLAVGTDVAALMLPYVKGGGTGPLDQLAAALDKISGGQPASSAPAPPRHSGP